MSDFSRPVIHGPFAPGHRAVHVFPPVRVDQRKDVWKHERPRARGGVAALVADMSRWRQLQVGHELLEFIEERYAALVAGPQNDERRLEEHMHQAWTRR